MSDTEMKEIITQALKEMAASKVEVDKAIEKMAAKVDATGEMIGYVSGRLGIIIELIVVPGICAEINKHNHKFTYVAPNMNIRKDKLQTQVDVMLYNTTEAMAVEIKTHLKKDDVIWHLNRRLTKIRQLETEFNVKDKVLYGAVAGITIDDEARNYALENGLYVIEIQENKKTSLKIDVPLNNKPKTW